MSVGDSSRRGRRRGPRGTTRIRLRRGRWWCRRGASWLSTHARVLTEEGPVLLDEPPPPLLPLPLAPPLPEGLDGALQDQYPCYGGSRSKRPVLLTFFFQRMDMKSVNNKKLLLLWHIDI